MLPYFKKELLRFRVLPWWYYLIVLSKVILLTLKNFPLDLKKATQSFSNQLKNFKLRYIGEVDVDDDLEYGKYFCYDFFAVASFNPFIKFHAFFFFHQELSMRSQFMRLIRNQSATNHISFKYDIIRGVSK